MEFSAWWDTPLLVIFFPLAGRQARNLSSDVLLTALRVLHKATQKLEGKGRQDKKMCESEDFFFEVCTYLESRFVLNVVWKQEVLFLSFRLFGIFAWGEWHLVATAGNGGKLNSI